MSAPNETLVEVNADDAPVDIEAIFRDQFERIARVIARVVGDPARAEELAVEVFVKLWRRPPAQVGNAEGWLYRVAVRKALNELRHRSRRARYEGLFGFGARILTPEELCSATEAQKKVRLVLAIIKPREAELLLLRSHGLSYDELASALDLNPVSVGTLLKRAQQAFRKEYIKRYGKE